MDILKISVLGTAGVLLGILLKDRAPEYVSLVTMGIGLVILGLAVGKISYLFQSLERLKQSLPIDGSYITTLLKMIGITYIGQFSSRIFLHWCTDRTVLPVICNGLKYAGSSGTAGYHTGISCMKRYWSEICAALFLAVVISCFGGVIVYASSAEQQITDQMELTDLQFMVDEMLGEKTFSVTEAFHRLLSGEEVLSEESVREFLHSLLFYGIEREKELIVKLLLLLLFAAIFSGFAGAFDNGQVGEISFYVVYLLVFTLLMNSFSGLSASLLSMLAWITEFMKELSPVYFMAVAAASGASSAAAFYQGVLLLVWLFQWILEQVLLPGVSLYILLRFVNHLSREEMLGKMAELIETVISWGLRTLLGVAAGLQVVRGLVAPVMDSLKRSAVGKTAGALPGIGSAVNAVTELVLTTAVLVRNSLGIALLLVILVVGAGPLVRYGLLSLTYRFLAAAAQPVSDKRLVEAFGTMAEGCALLMRILFTAEILCMLTFLILMAGGGLG